MNALAIILNIVLILISIVLIAVVLMQQGQRQGLGAIAGGAETFLGKNTAKGLDGKLAKITKIAAVIFIVLAIVTTMVVSHNSEYAQLANSAYLDGDHIHLTDGTTVELAEATEEQLAEIGLTLDDVDAVLAALESSDTEGEVHDDHTHNEDGTITDSEGNVITEEEAHGTADETETEAETEAEVEAEAETAATAEPAAEADTAADEAPAETEAE